MIIPVCPTVAQTGVLLKLLLKYAQRDGTCEHITEDDNILIFSNTQGYLAQHKNFDKYFSPSLYGLNTWL